MKSLRKIKSKKNMSRMKKNSNQIQNGFNAKIRAKFINNKRGPILKATFKGEFVLENNQCSNQFKKKRLMSSRQEFKRQKTPDTNRKPMKIKYKKSQGNFMKNRKTKGKSKSRKNKTKKLGKSQKNINKRRTTKGSVLKMGNILAKAKSTPRIDKNLLRIDLTKINQRTKFSTDKSSKRNRCYGSERIFVKEKKRIKISSKRIKIKPNKMKKIAEQQTCKEFYKGNQKGFNKKYLSGTQSAMRNKLNGNRSAKLISNRKKSKKRKLKKKITPRSNLKKQMKNTLSLKDILKSNVNEGEIRKKALLSLIDQSKVS